MGTEQIKDTSNARFFIKAIRRNAGNTEESGKVSISTKEIQDAVSENKHIPEFSYELDVLEIQKDCLLVNAIKINDTLISFENIRDTVKIDVWMVIPNIVPLVYEDVTAEKCFNYDDEHPVYYRLNIKTNVKKINKRSAFRIPVNLQCMITMGEHKGTVHGILKDVSYAGFGVEVDADLISSSVPHESVMDLMFSDVKITNDPIKVSGKCVRKVEIGSKIIYGAQCTKPPKQYRDYVSAKQTAKAKAKQEKEE